MIARSTRPSENEIAVRTKKRGVAVGVAALALTAAVGVWWFASRRGAEPQREDSAKRAERKVRSDDAHAAVRPSTTRASSLREPEEPLPPQKPHEVRDGMLMLSNGQLLPTNKLRKVSIADRKPRFKYAIFDHPTDNELAAILTLKPGQTLIGGPIRHKDYKADFLKSIETPVIVRKDDPADVQEVKRAVIEARLLIKEAIDRGEDPADVIKEAYAEAQKLAVYKDDIRREVLNMAKDGDYTEAEIDDLVAAANKMLAEKGIAPMNLGPIMKARLKVLKR